MLAMGVGGLLVGLLLGYAIFGSDSVIAAWWLLHVRRRGLMEGLERVLGVPLLGAESAGALVHLAAAACTYQVASFRVRHQARLSG